MIHLTIMISFITLARGLRAKTVYHYYNPYLVMAGPRGFEPLFSGFLP